MPCPSPRLSVDQSTGDAIMLFDSVDGIRMMSVLGGFPALFVILGAAASLIVMLVAEARGARSAA